LYSSDDNGENTDNGTDNCGNSVNSVQSSNFENCVLCEFSESRNSTFELQESDHLKFLYTNADSISNKWTELEALTYIHQPDVISITEAFPKSYESLDMSSYALEGYQSYVNQKFANVGNRGTCTLLFIRNNIEVIVWKDLTIYQVMKLVVVKLN